MGKIKILGTDTSKWGEDIDYNVMVSAGAKFTILKAGQGNWTDPYFEKNRTKAKGLIPRGSYWFFDDRYSPREQAEAYARALGNDPMEMPLVVDFERSYGGAYAGWSKLSTFIILLEEKFPEKEIMIYTRANYWENNSPPAGTPESEWFKKYKLWVAAYNTRPIEDQTLAAPWDRFYIWQFSADSNTRGAEFGASGTIAMDLNYFWGTPEEFAQLTGGGATSEPPIPETKKLYAGEVISEVSVNFRSGAGTTYPTISTSKPTGTKMLIDEFNIVGLGGSKWVHVVEVEGYSVDGYMASFWNGEVLIEISEIESIAYVETVSLISNDGGFKSLDTGGYDSVILGMSDGEGLSFPLGEIVVPEPDPPPLPEGVDYPYSGLKRKKQDSVQILTVSDFDSFEIVSPDGCLTIDKLSHDVACNGTGFEWNNCVSNQTVKVDGVLISPQYNYEPYAYWVNKKIKFSESSSVLKSVDNAISIRRYLVIDGVQNPNPSSAWDELHKWQLLGEGASGETIIISILDEVNLYEAARIMLEHGVINGGDLDSGGSVQTKVGEDIITVEGRGVANFIGFTFAQEVETIGTVAGGINLSIRRGASTGSGKIASLPSGTKIGIDSIISGDIYEWAKWSVYSPMKKNDGSKTYLDVDGAIGTVPDGLNPSVRRDASASSEKIASLSGGDKIEIDSVVSGDIYIWAKWSVYSAIKKNDGSKVYLDISIADPETTPPVVVSSIEDRLPYPWDEQVVPDEGEFAILLHDFQTSEWKFKPRSHYVNLDYKKDPPTNALPEMVKTWGCRPNDFIPLTAPYQWLWFEMLVHAAGGVLSFKDGKPIVTGGYMTLEQLLGTKIGEGWASLVANHRSFTDNHSANENGYYDHVLKMQINDKDPYDLRGDMEQKCLSSGGNLVKIKRDLGNMLEVYAIDTSLTVPTLADIVDKPWLWHWATQETMIQLAENIWRISPYPQIRINGAKTGTPFMFLGLNGVNLIEEHRLVRIENGATYSPYIRNI